MVRTLIPRSAHSVPSGRRGRGGREREEPDPPGADPDRAAHGTGSHCPAPSVPGPSRVTSRSQAASGPQGRRTPKAGVRRPGTSPGGPGNPCPEGPQAGPAAAGPPYRGRAGAITRAGATEAGNMVHR
jgi:hypothetical protein